MTTKMKELKSVDVEFLVDCAVIANDHAEVIETNTNKAAHRLKDIFGEKQPSKLELNAARDKFKQAFIAKYAAADAKLGVPHFETKFRVVRNGTKTTEGPTDQYFGRKKSATALWSRILKALGWREVRAGETRGRKAKVHLCPHCKKGFSFVKGKVAKAATAKPKAKPKAKPSE